MLLLWQRYNLDLTVINIAFAWRCKSWYGSVLYLYVWSNGVVSRFQHLLLVIHQSVCPPSQPSFFSNYWLIPHDFWTSSERQKTIKLKCPRSIVTEKFRHARGLNLCSFYKSYALPIELIRGISLWIYAKLFQNLFMYELSECYRHENSHTYSSMYICTYIYTMYTCTRGHPGGRRHMGEVIS